MTIGLSKRKHNIDHGKSKAKMKKCHNLLQAFKRQTKPFIHLWGKNLRSPKG